MGILLLAILVGMIGTGRVPSGGEMVLLGMKVAFFFAVTAAVATWILPYFDKYLHKAGAPVLYLSFIVLLGAVLAAIVAELLGLHFMVGAFFAGVLIRDRFGSHRASIHRIEGWLKWATVGFLGPIFFASRGLHLDLDALQIALPFTLTLLVAAVIGKLLGCALPARLAGVPAKESMVIGMGMSGRGGVELIVASVALEAGVFSQPQPVPSVVSAMFSAVIIMAIATSLIAVLGLKLLLKDKYLESC